jgi:hypothetical protein
MSVEPESIFPISRAIGPPLRFLFYRNRYREAMREADALDRAGLSQEAISVLRKANILCPNCPEPYIQIAMAQIKLRRYGQAKESVDFARNHVRTKRQRFGLLMIDLCIAFENFRQDKNQRTADDCHHIVDCLLDLESAHPFPLHVRVLLHLELAVDPCSMEVRRAIESERGLRAIQRYFCLADRFPVALRKYHARFAIELKSYLDAVPEEDRPFWMEAFEHLTLFADQSTYPSNSTFQPTRIMKKFAHVLAIAAFACFQLVLGLTAGGIMVIDIGDLC